MLVIEEEPVQPGRVEKQTPYAYLIEYTDYLAPRTLFSLLNQGVRVKAAFKGFSVKTATGTRQLAPGTLLIPVQYQEVDEASLYHLVSASVADTGLTVYAVDGGTSLEGIDLGSDSSWIR